jgi:hypothetical protein
MRTRQGTTADSPLRGVHPLTHPGAVAHARPGGESRDRSEEKPDRAQGASIRYSTPNHLALGLGSRRSSVATLAGFPTATPRPLQAAAPTPAALSKSQKHLRIDRRDDPPLPDTTMKPLDTVIVNIEILPDKLAQQLVRLGDRLTIEQILGLLDRPQRPQRPLGILRHPGERPLPLALVRHRQSGFSDGCS